MNYVGLSVQIHGLSRWGDAGDAPEAIRLRVERAVRLAFAEHELDGDIVVELEESSG